MKKPVKIEAPVKVVVPPRIQNPGNPDLQNYLQKQIKSLQDENAELKRKMDDNKKQIDAWQKALNYAKNKA